MTYRTPVREHARRTRRGRTTVHHHLRSVHGPGMTDMGTTIIPAHPQNADDWSRENIAKASEGMTDAKRFQEFMEKRFTNEGHYTTISYAEEWRDRLAKGTAWELADCKTRAVLKEVYPEKF